MRAASSLQDVAYEAKRELTERRPGARIEERHGEKNEKTRAQKNFDARAV